MIWKLPEGVAETARWIVEHGYDKPAERPAELPAGVQILELTIPLPKERKT